MNINGHPDLSKVDISNDFMDFPKLFNTPEDIEQFITDRNVDVPVLRNLLKLRTENKLDITPTETKFYFDEIFEYIYDVYRVPVEETYIRMIDWLDDIESTLVHGGFIVVKRESFNNTRSQYEMNSRLDDFYKEHNLKRKTVILEKINYFTDVKTEYPEYYISNRPTLIESFWIKTDRHSIQPVISGDEAYARVHVFPDRVYIFGCDDYSYTFTTKTEQEAKDFANYLKCGSPVWNFSFPIMIHENLVFTN